MALSQDADGSEDVNDFLVRIRELGVKRDMEDEERTRKLEEEILQGRREREARRAERARSISPIKDASSSSFALSSSTLQDPPISASTSQSILPPVNLLPSSFTQDFNQSLPDPETRIPETLDTPDDMKPATSNSTTTTLSRRLSWKQRPGSRDLGQKPFASTKLSGVKAAAPVQEETIREASTEPDDSTTSISRAQIAQSLSTKDPGWFRQTSDRGGNSPAYRRADSSSFSEATPGAMSVKLPGLSRQSVSDLGVPRASDLSGGERSRSPSRTSSMYGASSYGNRYSSISSISTGGLGSPVPLTSPRRHERAPSIHEEQLPSEQITMSPSQGRITGDRPPSPTKGLGGFVQSAMLKRSDSVSKRWSGQAHHAQRGSISSINRSDIMPQKPLNSLGLAPGGILDSSAPRSDSRPSSSHSEATVVRHSGTEDMPIGRPDHLRSRGDSILSPSTETLSKHSIPGSPRRRHDSVSFTSTKNSDLPISPSKTMDPKRWSPTKASWLESALNKPESKPKPRVPQEPEWKRDLTDRLRKAKEAGQTDNATDSEKSSPLIGSPNTNGSGTPQQKPDIQPDAQLQETEPTPATKTSNELPEPLDGVKPEIPVEKPLVRSPSVPPKSEKLKIGTDPSVGDKRGIPSLQKLPSEPILSTIKPQTPTESTFRSNLRPRQTETGGAAKNEPEFKAVFGKLRRTETKNYVAPDELKGNILRGKAALNTTGGPKKSARVDEFKETILKQKEAIKAGGGSIRQPVPDKNNNTSTVASVSPPEAIMKRNTLAKSESVRDNLASKSPTITPAPKPRALSSSPSTQSLSDASKAQTSEAKSQSPPTSLAPKTETPPISNRGAIAGRLNPSLAGLLARGPPTISSQPTIKSSNSQISESSPSDASSTTLTHMTKSRAKGPKRRLPQNKQTNTSSPGNGRRDTSTVPPKSAELRKPSEQLRNSKPLKLEIRSSSGVNPDVVQRYSPSIATKPIISPTTSMESHTSIPSPGREKPKQPEKPILLRSTSNSIVKDKPSPPTKSSTLPATLPSNTISNVNSSIQQSAKPRTTAATEQKPALEAKVEGNSVTAPMIRKSSYKAEQSPERFPSQSKVQNTSFPPEQRTTKASKPAVPSSKPNLPTTFAQTPEAAKILVGFFNEPPTAKDKVAVDPQAALMSRPESYPKIKTIKKQVWELTGDGKQKDLPPNQEYILFEESLYLCVHTFETSSGNRHTEVNLWCGDGIGEAAVDDAQLFARRVARENNCKLEVLKQGKETTNFIQALGGIIIIRRGRSNRSDSSSAYMLCGRRHMGQISFDEVDLNSHNLCSGFPFIVSANQGKSYLWKGLGSTADELGCARLIGMDIGLTGEIQEITEGQEPQSFFDIFPPATPRVPSSADFWRLKPNHQKYCCRLFRVDHELGQRFGASFWNRRGTSSPVSRPNDIVQEIEPFCQRDLDPAHIYVLDAFFEIYVIVGEQANTRHAEFASALVFAQEYGILAVSEQDRPFLPKSYAVLNGLPDECKYAFRKWDDRAYRDSSKTTPTILPLATAIDAIR
ncbi:hypothetical protein FQN57_001841 [Myotisia sp. PD_48]|nr:hypothetical protein FQN57_001841 [Myotisia sp. PD_48]